MKRDIIKDIGAFLEKNNIVPLYLSTVLIVIFFFVGYKNELKE